MFSYDVFLTFKKVNFYSAKSMRRDRIISRTDFSLIFINLWNCFTFSELHRCKQGMLLFIGVLLTICLKWIQTPSWIHCTALTCNIVSQQERKSLFCKRTKCSGMISFDFSGRHAKTGNSNNEKHFCHCRTITLECFRCHLDLSYAFKSIEIYALICHVQGHWFHLISVF